MLVLVGGEESLYDSIRSSAYAIQASVGWPGLIMYGVLIYLLIKFLFMYFKRFLVVAILTFMAPIIGVTYSIDKIKDNKSQSLSNWLKEYTFNVIIQSVHALLYTLMVSLAFNMAGKSISGSIIAILLLNFILKAEVIFKKIFGIKSGSLKDALKSTLAVMAGVKIAKSVASRNFKLLGKVTKPVTSPIKNIASRASQYKRNDKVEKVKKAIESAKKTGDTNIKVGRNNFSIASLLNEPNFNSTSIAESLVSKDEEIKEQNKEYIKNAMKETFNTIGGTAQAIAAIPVAVVDPEKGAVMISNARAQLKKGINGYSKEGKNYKGKHAIAKNLLTAGAYTSARNLRRKNLDYVKNMNNSVMNAQHEMAVDKLQKQIEKQKKELVKTVDKKELEKVIQSASSTVSEDAIINTTYMMQAIMDTKVNVKIVQSEKISQAFQEVNDKIDMISEGTENISELYQQIEATNNSGELYFEIDQQKFEKNIQKELRKKVSRGRGKNKVTKLEIEKEYERMEKEEKSELIKNAVTNSRKKNKSIKAQLEDISNDAQDTKTLYGNIEKLNKSSKKSVEIDQKKFEKDINKQLIGLVSKETNKRKKDITRAEIEDRFKSMSKDERNKMVNKTILKYAKLTEEEKQKVKETKTNMNLDNVNEIIDSIKEKVGKKVQERNYKENFEKVVKTNIEFERGINSDQITKDDIYNYISNLTNDELIIQIKTAGAYQDSLKRNKNCNKEEYEEIVRNIEKMNLHKAQMKG